MSKKKKQKRKYKKEKYPLEIEAAWYVLIQFISTFDYVIRYMDINDEKHIATANPNCVIAANMSKTNLFKPSPICKYMLQEHFDRDVIIFYKCAPNKKLSTGYGRYDKNALALPFSTYLNITTKRTTDGKYFVLLVGIDIDCHNGEKHVKEVEELIKKYLPNTYWENSTNGKGRHGYLKIKFINSFGVIEYITKCLKMIFSKLNELKNLHGYEAEIDDPAGLPYKREFKGTNPYYKEWTTLFYKPGKEYKFLGRFINPKSKIWNDFITYLNNSTIHRIPDECYSKPATLDEWLLEEQIKDSFSKFLSDNNISFPPPTKNNSYYEITVQRAFKLPLFGAIESVYTHATPRIDCIKEFHDLPYYTSSELKTAYNQIREDIKNFVGIYNSSISSGISCYYSFPSNSNINPVSDDINNTSCPSSDLDSEDPYSFPILLKEEDKASSTHSRCSFVTETFTQTTEIVKNNTVLRLPSIKKERKKEVSNNCACTNTLNNTEKHTNDKPRTENNPIIYADIIDWSEFIENKEEFDIDKYWENYKQNKNGWDNNKYEEIIDTLKDEADTMKRTVLFIPAFINKIGRIPTITEAEKEYVILGLNRNSAIISQNRRNRFKGCIDFYSGKYDKNKRGFSSNWTEEKDKVLKLIEPHFPEELVYKQGKRIKPMTQEEIGYVYHIIKRMEESYQDFIIANSLSYSRADELFEKEFGCKCGRHKFSGIIKILLNASRIEKSGNYKVGLRGNCYRIVGCREP